MSARLEFQGSGGSDTYLDTLIDLILDPSTTRISGVFAFASANGVTLLFGDDRVRERLVEIDLELVVGLDAVTDRRALTELKKLSEEYPRFVAQAVPTTTAGSLFHPKMVRVDQEHRIVLAVGSSNLTSGGLVGNFEANLVVDAEVGGALAEAWNVVVGGLGAIEITDALIESVPERRYEPHRRPVLPHGAGVPEPNAQVLLARLPRAGDRWSQAHFNRDVVPAYFGVEVGSDRVIVLHHEDPSGGWAAEPPRRCVYSERNMNPKIELGVLHGVAYPEDGTPIAVFLRTGTRVFNYVVLMPDDDGFAGVEQLLLDSPTIGRGLERAMVPYAALAGVWPSNPFEWVEDEPEAG